MMLVASFVVPAFAAPRSSSTAAERANAARLRAEQSRARVAAAVRDYAVAHARYTEIQTQLDRNSARLDTAVDRQQRLQRRLGARASGMYRRGMFEFIEVLTSSASFYQFSSLWDALTRINRRDAQAIDELKRTRAEIAATSATLLKQQTEASAELRKLDAAEAEARRRLGSDRAAYAQYMRQVNAVAAANRAKAAQAQGAASPSSSEPSARPEADHGHQARRKRRVGHGRCVVLRHGRRGRQDREREGDPR